MTETELKLGDSGSWVLDTSEPTRYKVLGSVVATSTGAAHFISFHDQAEQIVQILPGRPNVSLISSFRALVNCAYLAQRRNYADSQWFADEMLSPHALRQLSNGWYLPAIKVLVGVEASEHDDGRANTSQRDVLKGLLLRYGTTFLDSLVHPYQWLEEHRGELNWSEEEVYQTLMTAVQPLVVRERIRIQGIQSPHVTFHQNTESHESSNESRYSGKFFFGHNLVLA
jgi:hypothetical protein